MANIPNDMKVRDTIFLIIEEFFASNPNILLYQCETGDNRQAMRDRLFLRWFKNYEHNDRFYIKVSTIVAEKVKNYAAMIVAKKDGSLAANKRMPSHRYLRKTESAGLRGMPCRSRCAWPRLP